MNWRKKIKKVSPEKEQEYVQRFMEEKPDVKDKFAMLLAAFLTLVIPAFLVVACLVLFVLWIFGINIFS